MDIITDPKDILPRLQKQVERNGHSPEHHANLLLHYEVGENYSPVFFDFGAKGAILAQRDGHFWWMLGEPIAREKAQTTVFHEALVYMFKGMGAKKLTLENWKGVLREEAAIPIKALGLRLKKPFRNYFWPVYDLKEYREDLLGKKFKGMRYARNRFLNNHEIEIKDPRNVKQKDLEKLLGVWGGKRSSRDKTYFGEYAPMIANKFPGCDVRRAIFIDGVLRALSIGWHVPNSTSCYLFLLIHDYSDEYLGEFVGLDHFLAARGNGYEFLDFGGSDKNLLNFKKKFHPVRIYTTYNFSIVKKGK